MKLYLDDVREAPEGFELRVPTAREALEMLLRHSINVLSLDHDLGEGQPTGYDLLVCMDRLKLTVPKILVHSMNPEAKAQMEEFITTRRLEG